MITTGALVLQGNEGASAIESGDKTTSGPGGATNTVNPGPNRLTRSRLMPDSTRAPIPRTPHPISQELALSLLPRLMRRVEVHPETGCWFRGKGRYSNITVTQDGKTYWLMAHRVAYVAAYGPLPPDLTVDHLCEQPRCCNPLHLQAVTHRENILRSRTNPCAIHARKTECSEGHPLPTPTGNPGRPRKCAICRKKRARERYLAKKARGEV